MSSRSKVGDLKNLKDSLQSWISEHLGEGSPYTTDGLNQHPSSSMEEPRTPEGNTLKGEANQPTIPEEHLHSPMGNPLIATLLINLGTNIMTTDELDSLKESCSFPPNVQIRMPEEGETIASTCPGEVAFYEAAFHAGLCFPIHPTIRMILQFYNVCLAQLLPDAWQSVVCAIALWQAYKYAISLFEFRNLFNLNKNPKPGHGWLYFKARPNKTLLEGNPSNVKG